MIRKSALLIVLVLFAFSVPVMACDGNKSAVKTTSGTSDNATVKTANATADKAACVAGAGADQSACTGMKSSTDNSVVKTANSTGDKAACAMGAGADKSGCTGVKSISDKTAMKSANATGEKAACTASASADKSACAGMKSTNASYANATGSPASFEGEFVCVGCDKKMTVGSDAACGANGHKYAIKTADGKYISLLDNKQSQELVTSGKYRNKNVKVQGVFYANANELEVKSFELDEKLVNQ